MSNKNRVITFRVNKKEEEILDKLCKKYDKKPSSLLIFLLEKEYYFEGVDENEKGRNKR